MLLTEEQAPHKDFCVYLTIYDGDMLPEYYIGSSSTIKVTSGVYNGTVTSKKYGETYRNEQRNNKHLFRSIVLKTFDDRKEAIEYERMLQIKHNVVKSDDFFNMSVAAPNGYFGRDVSGKNNPRYGKPGLVGKNGARWTGFHCFRDNITETSQQLTDVLKETYGHTGPSSVRRWCTIFNDKKVTKYSYNHSMFISSLGCMDEIVGKTYKELGFSLIKEI